MSRIDQEAGDSDGFRFPLDCLFADVALGDVHAGYYITSDEPGQIPRGQTVSRPLFLCLFDDIIKKKIIIGNQRKFIVYGHRVSTGL